MKTWDLEFAANSEFEFGVESESMHKEPITESKFVRLVCLFSFNTRRISGMMNLGLER